MNRELQNPFQEPGVTSSNEQQFIKDVLGAEAAVAFAKISGSAEENQPSTSFGEANFQLSKDERRLVETELPADFWERLEEIHEQWEQYRVVQDLETFLSNEAAWSTVRLNPQQLQTLCNRFTEYTGFVMDRNVTGALFSTILNKSIDALPIRERETIHLVMKDIQDVENLGWRWATGTLEFIDASTNDFIGSGMRGGTIIADTVRHWAGRAMDRGTLKVNNAGEFLGEGMRGGMIIASHVGNKVGHVMVDGHIVVGSAGKELGQDMRGGTITAESAKDFVGDEMAGEKALIQVKQAGDCLGYQMRAGTIIVDHAGNGVGSEIRLDVNRANHSVIRVRGSAKSYSKDRSDGKIFRPDGTEVYYGDIK